jgi:hypothetical protein
MSPRGNRPGAGEGRSDPLSGVVAKSHEGARPVTPGVNALRFRCPVSGREIESDFSADAHTLSMIRLFSVRLHCPACGRPHEFKMGEALSIGPHGEAAEHATSQADDKMKPQGGSHTQSRV